MKVARTHDSLYLKENRKLTPKESFKFMVQESSAYLKKFTHPDIVDIGCAAGDFLWYLSQVYPNAHLTGIDVMPALIERARKEVSAVKFILGNIDTGKGLPDEKFDCVFMSGVHSIFDDITPCLSNAIRLLRKNGRAYIFGIFNPIEVDVLLKVRYANSNGPWEAGWNLFSKRTVANYLEQKGYTYNFKDWRITIDIPPNPQDYLRSWTFRLEDKSRMIVSGIQLLHHFSLLEICP